MAFFKKAPWLPCKNLRCVYSSISISSIAFINRWVSDKATKNSREGPGGTPLKGEGPRKKTWCLGAPSISGKAFIVSGRRVTMSRHDWLSLYFRKNFFFKFDIDMASDSW